MRSEYSHKNQKPSSFDEGFIGAATRIRTGDLILTKDVLYQLSHSSVFVSTDNIITDCGGFVNRKFVFFKKIFFRRKDADYKKESRSVSRVLS